METTRMKWILPSTSIVLKQILPGKLWDHFTTCPSCPSSQGTLLFNDRSGLFPEGIGNTTEKKGLRNPSLSPQAYPGVVPYESGQTCSPPSPASVLIGIGLFQGRAVASALTTGESKWEPTRERRPRRQTNSQWSIGLICRQARHQTRVGRLPVWSIYHESWDAVGLPRDQVCISKMPWGEVVPSLPTRSLKVYNSSEPAKQSLHKGSLALPEAQLSDMGHLLTPPTGHPMSCSTVCLRLADHSTRKSDRNQRLISHPSLYQVHFSKADLPMRHTKQYFQPWTGFNFFFLRKKNEHLGWRKYFTIGC